MICSSLSYTICSTLTNTICFRLTYMICSRLTYTVCSSLSYTICSSLSYTICSRLTYTICSLSYTICSRLTYTICSSLTYIKCCSLTLIYKILELDLHYMFQPDEVPIPDQHWWGINLWFLHGRLDSPHIVLILVTISGYLQHYAIIALQCSLLFMAIKVSI